ncbi:MAG: hypothetical protein ACOYM7_09050 [Paludibacter sp.]|jgi:hypothetical protein
MNTKTKVISKKTYCQPEIEMVVVDSEISLQLNSLPPAHSNENTQLFEIGGENDNPFKTYLG